MQDIIAIVVHSQYIAVNKYSTDSENQNSEKRDNCNTIIIIF